MTKTSNRNLNVALVGTGMVASTHLQVLADLSDNLQLNGVFSRNTEHSQSFAENASQLIGSKVNSYSSHAPPHCIPWNLKTMYQLACNSPTMQ